MTFADWTANAEANLKRRYAIGLNDAGFGEKYLQEAWRDGEAPDEFVERIALKYDLDPVPVGWCPTA